MSDIGTSWPSCFISIQKEKEQSIGRIEARSISWVQPEIENHVTTTPLQSFVILVYICNDDLTVT